MNTHVDPRSVHPNHPQFRAPHGAPPFSREPYPSGRPPFAPAPPFGGHPPFTPPQGFPGRHPGPVPPPSTPLPEKRPIAGRIIAGLVAAGLVVGGVGAWYTLSDSTPAVQATSFAGADPTTSPFGTDHAEVATVAAAGAQPGDTAGLYAATTPPACDNAAFLQELQADPAKLAAWGGVFGLQAADVPAFVDSLSPVVLRAATSVTDHPFRDGAFVEEPAILAAGTAVLVNSYGEPTVKCYNGNPLSAGHATDDAITVYPTTEVIAEYHYTSVDNSRVVIVPGKPDPKPNPGPNPRPTNPGTGTGTGTTGTPDPALVAKAEEAKKLSDQARTEATASRERADSLGINARVFRSEADRLQGLAEEARAALAAANTTFNAAVVEVQAAKAQVPQDPARIAAAEQARNAAGSARAKADDARKAASQAATKADQDADTAESQHKFAESKATNDENVAKAAEENTKKAEDEAAASARSAPKQAVQEPGTEVQEQDETLTGVQGGQAPVVPAAGEQAPAEGTTDGTAPGATACPAGTTDTGDPAAPCTAAAPEAPPVEAGEQGTVTGGTETETGTTSGTETATGGSEESGTQTSSEGTDS